MNRAARVIADVDMTVMLVDRHVFTADDEMILERIQKSGCQLILAINKVDRAAATSDPSYHCSA